MNNVKAIQKANEEELKLGIAGGAGSWHARYAHSPVVYIGGIPKNVQEDDILTIFEQMGTVVHVNLVRDEKSGHSRGFAFVAYDDVRSAVIAVDNFNGVKLAGSTLCVDHVDDYKPPATEHVEVVASVNRGQHENTDLEASVRPEHAFVGMAVDSAANAQGHNEHAGTLKDDDSEDVRLRQMMHRLAAMRQKRESLERPDSQPAASAPSEPSRIAALGHLTYANSGAEELRPELSVENNRTSVHEGAYAGRLARKEQRRQIREQRAEKRARKGT
jgi:RNA recognition motif. (a.k.a. RRM, RBD, or RNP domain)